MITVNPDHPMTKLTRDNISKFLVLVLYNLCRERGFTCEITTKDMEAFSREFGGEEQYPTLAVEGLQDRIVLRLVDEATGQALAKALGDPNSPRAKMMVRVMEARKQAPGLAERLAQASKKTLSVNSGLMAEAAEVMKLLVWEPNDVQDEKTN